MPPIGAYCFLGDCPDWEINLLFLGVWNDTQPTAMLARAGLNVLNEASGHCFSKWVIEILQQQIFKLKNCQS